MLKTLARVGWEKAPHQTPHEFCQALDQQQAPHVALVGEITQAYYRARFGGAVGSHERERLAMMVDQGSFVEIGQLALSSRKEVAEKAPADALITGVGTIDGRKCALVVKQDLTGFGKPVRSILSDFQPPDVSSTSARHWPSVSRRTSSG